MKIKIRILINSFLMMGLLVMLTNSCKKEEKIQIPLLTTSAIRDTAQTTATCGGNITSDGGSTITARGVCWNKDVNPTIANSITIDGAGVGSFTSAITGLTGYTSYYVRAYATNNAGTGYGDTQWFRTPSVPVPTTSDVIAITLTTAYCQCENTSDNYFPVTASGLCWSTGATPTISDSKTTISYLTGLTPNTTYYIRAYATNKIGTGYGNAVKFTTMGYGANVTDIDGNVYHTVNIGTQIWMVENLKTTKYRNGDLIPNVTNAWYDSSTTGAYCDYDNTPSNSTTYGRLYNWHAVIDTRGIAPAGWHVPTMDEWGKLNNYLHTTSYYENGGKLKETGTTHWQSPNTGATNETGFTALPGGNRGNGARLHTSFSLDSFCDIGYAGYWWSSDVWIGGTAYQPMLVYNSLIDNWTEFGWRSDGYSVRCIKD